MCVFCNQRTISGVRKFDPETVPHLIEEALATCGGAECEIAYFGGSFTGIERSLMVSLLDIAESYVKDGKVVGTRMSTRPDYIDEDVVDILKKYTVTQIELGIQSMSDKVLEMSGRGHTADDTRRAVLLLKENGFDVVGQMMIGLPGSEAGDEIDTAREICSMGCSAARIYPTIVFKDTELDRMYARGEYTPLTVDDAAERSASVLEIFDENGVGCLRIGLCDSEELHGDSSYSAGPLHAALGEIVMSRLFLRRIISGISELAKDTAVCGRSLLIECPRGCVSKVIGNRKENVAAISSEFGIKRIKTIENDDLIGYNIKVSLIQK